jgi:hypothetical protein
LNGATKLVIEQVNLPHASFGFGVKNQDKWQLRVTDLDLANVETDDSILLVGGKDGKPFHLNPEAVEDVLLLVDYKTQ